MVSVPTTVNESPGFPGLNGHHNARAVWRLDGKMLAIWGRLERSKPIISAICTILLAELVVSKNWVPAFAGMTDRFFSSFS